MGNGSTDHRRPSNVSMTSIVEENDNTVSSTASSSAGFADAVVNLLAASSPSKDEGDLGGPVVSLSVPATPVQDLNKPPDFGIYSDNDRVINVGRSSSNVEPRSAAAAAALGGGSSPYEGRKVGISGQDNQAFSMDDDGDERSEKY